MPRQVDLLVRPVEHGPGGVEVVVAEVAEPVSYRAEGRRVEGPGNQGRQEVEAHGEKSEHRVHSQPCLLHALPCSRP